MYPFIAGIPFLVFFLLILFAKRGVLFSIISAFVALLFTSVNYWGMEWLRIFSAMGKGVFVATEIILIVFGALLILESLKTKKMLLFLKDFFESISMDKRVHIILIAFALIFFLEGVAGFGAPVIIAVPILIALGFAPLTAVMLALIGDSLPVIFGAIGLPVTYGIRIPLEQFALGVGFENSITLVIAMFNILGSVIIPLILLFVFTKMEDKPISHFFEFIPFAFVAGLSASVPALITAYFIGPELPSVIGGICAIFFVAFMAKKDILIIRTEKSEELKPVAETPREKTKMFKAVFPYVLISVILFLTRIPYLPFKNIVSNFSVIKIDTIFGEYVNYAFAPFYSAGIILILVACISFLILRLDWEDLKKTCLNSYNKIKKPYLSLIVMLGFVQVFMYSGENLLGLKSMPAILAEGGSFVFGSVWPIFAPFIGALGSFTSGSATVSNLIFSSIQYETALLSGFSPVIILALQGIGAAGGNMIALHNVIAGLAVAGIVGKEGLVVRKNMVPLIFYLLIIGLLGFIISIIKI